jgi:hypothetical protein
MFFFVKNLPFWGESRVMVLVGGRGGGGGRNIWWFLLI